MNIRQMNNPHGIIHPALRYAALALTLSVTAGLGLASGGRAQAQEQQQQKFGETVVTADNIDYDLGKKQVIASGNVDLVSGNSRITAEKMTVQMAANKGLDWARCEGKVVVEKKNPADNSTMTARGQSLDYLEKDQKAKLQGDVIAHLDSPRLAKPAVITGERVDMDLTTRQNVVTRSAAAQAKIHVEPKGKEGSPTPEPLDLAADRIEMNSATQEYIATGKPVLLRPTSKLQAKRLRFQVQEETNDVKVAYAEEEVIFDGQGESGSVIHSTGDNAVFTRDVNELVVTGMVLATVKDPDDEKPTVYQGSKFTYNTKTRASRLSGPGARVTFPGGNLPVKRAGTPAAAGGADKKPAAPAGTDNK